MVFLLFICIQKKFKIKNTTTRYLSLDIRMETFCLFMIEKLVSFNMKLRFLVLKIIEKELNILGFTKKDSDR